MHLSADWRHALSRRTAARSVATGSQLTGVSFAALVMGFVPLGVLALAFARLAFLEVYLDTHASRSVQMWRALGTGLLFDLKVLAVLSLTLLAVAGMLAVRLPWRHGRRIVAAALCTAFALLLLPQVCQHYFYGYFKTAFTPVVFGFAEDDTVAVLGLIWNDYPLPGMLVGLAATLATLTWAALQVHDVLAPWFMWRSRAGRWALRVMLLLALLLMARGSLGTFPLRRTDAEISDLPVVNDSVRNGLFAICDAWVDRVTEVTRITRANEYLPHYGFASALDAAHALGQPARTEDEVEQWMFERTPHNAAAEHRPPHVVMALMESWSGALLQYHDPAHNDLLGRLAPHKARDHWFSHFYPVHGNTHATLEGLLLNSPLTPLTLGRYGQHPFATSAARPFKEAGYRTVFVYGGASNWRSLRSVFTRQFFDECYGQANILARYPDAAANSWGAYDEYVMRFVGDLIDEADRAGQKLFVFFLTTTNHPPHALPPGARRLPLDLSRVGGPLKPSTHLTLQVLQTYQYANDQLGALIDRIEAAPYADRTLVAATGDHNMKIIFDYKLPAQMHDLQTVPLYLRVPAAYAEGTRQDPLRFGSHLDIMPTLYRLALSDARYVRTGHSMLHPLPADADYGMTMYDTLFSAEGAVSPVVGLSRYFAWRGNALLQPTDTPPDSLRRKSLHARALTALQDWLIRRNVLREAG